MKILINVVNARNVGGGLQIVHNFLLGTLKYKRDGVEWYYAVSECLDNNYLDADFKSHVSERYFVFPNQPDFLGTYWSVQKSLRKLEKNISPDVVYTILGPCYNFFKNTEVIRFVNSWVVASNKYAWSLLTAKKSIRMKLHNILLKQLLKKTKFIVTQTEAIKQGLICQLKKNPKTIRVVNNVLPEIYLTMDNTPMEGEANWVEIPVVGGGEHKNLDIVPDIILELEKEYNIKNYRFHVTLPDSSTILPKIKQKAQLFGLDDRLVNHGNMKQEELALLYRKSRINFLPSVLEVFSATTIESMFFQLPTVATNLLFNTDVFHDSCLYYTPTNVKEATSQIVKAVTDENLRQELKEKMKVQLTRFSDFEKYFNETVDFLVEVGEGKID